MGSPFFLCSVCSCSSLWDGAEGSIKIYYSLHVSGLKGIAAWGSSCPAACGPNPSLSHVGHSSLKPIAECGLLSIKCKRNADLDSRVSSGLHLKNSVDNALCALSMVHVYVYMC